MTARACNQRGYALLLILVLTATASAIVAVPYLSRLTFDNDPVARKLRSANALKEAREALIAYSAIEDNSPGSLPCPDQDNDGVAQSDIGSNSCTAPYIGRLPWKTLGLGKLTDGEGECLWYALSPDFRNTIGTSQRGTGETHPAINPANLGSLNVVSSVAPTEPVVVAAVFAPGKLLPNQTRGSSSLATCASGEASDFLEDNNSGGGSVTMSDESTSFNDIALPLSANKLFLTVGKRVLGALAIGEPNGGRGITNLVMTADQIAVNSNKRIQRSDTTNYTAQQFDNSLQSMSSVSGKVHYVLSSSSPSPPSCPNYLAKYTTTTLPNTVVPAESPQPTVPPAEWLCRNDWYEHVAYEVSPFSPLTSATLSISSPPSSRTLAFP